MIFKITPQNFFPCTSLPANDVNVLKECSLSLSLSLSDDPGRSRRALLSGNKLYVSNEFVFPSVLTSFSVFPKTTTKNETPRCPRVFWHSNARIFRTRMLLSKYNVQSTVEADLSYFFTIIYIFFILYQKQYVLLVVIYLRRLSIYVGVLRKNCIILFSRGFTRTSEFLDTTSNAYDVFVSSGFRRTRTPTGVIAFYILFDLVFVLTTETRLSRRLETAVWWISIRKQTLGEHLDRKVVGLLSLTVLSAKTESTPPPIVRTVVRPKFKDSNPVRRQSQANWETRDDGERRLAALCKSRFISPVHANPQDDIREQNLYS